MSLRTSAHTGVASSSPNSKGPHPNGCGPIFSYLLGESQELGSIQLVIGLNKACQLFRDLFRTANGVGLDVQGKQRIVQRKTQQEPAVAVCLIKVDADTLEVAGSQAPAFLSLGISGQFVDYLLAIGLEVIQQDVHTELLALCRLLQVGNEGFQGVAFLLAASQLDEELGNDVSAVIQEVVLLECTVTGGLDCQLAVLAQTVQTDGFVDNITVATPETIGMVEEESGIIKRAIW